MDVDLLRPGNVPISPNTVLWFEFLLEPNLLAEHLKKPNPDPVPTDLLIKFLMLSVEPHTIDEFEKTRSLQCSKRQLCMKILAFKIVAHWKWDLEMIESKLPLQLQYVLLRDFLYLSGEGVGDGQVDLIRNHTMDFEKLRDHHIFALSLYHRWALHVIVNSPMVNKNFLFMTTMNVESADDIMSSIMDDESRSEEVLQKIIALRKSSMIIPTFNSFAVPTESDNQEETWNIGLEVPGSRFYSQIYYDLGVYKVYRELTVEATECFTLCNNLYDEANDTKASPSTYEFCEVREERLMGFCRACGVSQDRNENLVLKFYSSIRKNYANIIAVLQADNLAREIPLTYRDSLELDLASTLASGKFTATRDLLFQIQTLNVVRRVIDGASHQSVLDYVAKLDAFSKGNKILVNALKAVLQKATSDEKYKIKLFLKTLLDKCDSARMQNILDDELRALFEENELKEDFTKQTEEAARANFLYLTNVEKTREQKIKMIGNNQLEIHTLERQIINTYEPAKLKELVRRFISLSGNRPLMNVYNKWKVVPIVCQAISSLTNTFVQQYCYVVLAKVKELVEFQNFKLASNLLDSAEKEVKKRTVCEILRWEALYIAMVELQTNETSSVMDRNMLIDLCKEVLEIVQPGGATDFYPRTQIVDLAALTLLNIEPEYVASCNYQKRMFPFLDLAFALSAACADLTKFKNNKKLPKEAWELVIPAFVISNPNVPRRHLGAEGEFSKMALIQFGIRLRNTSVINVVLSLLAKIHNVLRDEPNLELYYMYAQMWPPSIVNANNCNPDTVIEVIGVILEELLKYQPTNGSWLKLVGDVNFVKGHYSTALKNYFEALVAASDYFLRPVPKTVVEDFIYRRMVKCCMMLQCYTQAAVLCQFLDEVDYPTAFKCLSETMNADAADCYYDCIWDVNVLEFLIALHSKRNEHNKKQKAIEVIGLLELNSNNNDEIKREAANMRKTKFLRAMAKHANLGTLLEYCKKVEEQRGEQRYCSVSQIEPSTRK